MFRYENYRIQPDFIAFKIEVDALKVFQKKPNTVPHPLLFLIHK